MRIDWKPALVAAMLLGTALPAAADHPMRNPWEKVKWPKLDQTLTPLSPFYRLEVIGEGIGSLFSGSGERGLEAALSSADERLVELRYAVVGDDPKAAGWAACRHAANFEKAQEIVAAMPEGERRRVVGAAVLDRLIDHQYMAANYFNQVYHLPSKKPRPEATQSAIPELIVAIRERMAEVKAASPESLYGSVPWRTTEAQNVVRILMRDHAPKD